MTTIVPLQMCLSKVKILTDPWLVGQLTFLDQDWFFAGEMTGELDIDRIVEDVDVILLSQSLDDHTHKPTLQRLPKHIPVVGSPGAAAIAEALGFSNVVALDHDQQVRSTGCSYGNRV